MTLHRGESTKPFLRSSKAGGTVADRLFTGKAASRCGSRPRSGGEDRERFPTSHRRRRSAPDVFPIHVPFRHALQDLVEGNPTLEPRQRCTQAVVDAIAEGEELTAVAVDVEPVRI